MYLGAVFFTDTSCRKTGTSLKPCASLFLRLSPLPQPASFTIRELDCSSRLRQPRHIRLSVNEQSILWHIKCRPLQDHSTCLCGSQRDKVWLSLFYKLLITSLSNSRQFLPSAASRLSSNQDWTHTFVSAVYDCLSLFFQHSYPILL
jgi:hypothetical protein